jgi:predicted transcriptional regulator
MAREITSLRLPRETIKKLRELACKEGKDRSTVIREILERGKEERIRIKRLSFIKCGKSRVGRQLKQLEYPCEISTRLHVKNAFSFNTLSTI